MGLGSDFSAITDLDANFTFLEGDANEGIALIQAFARRLVTPRAGDPWDPAYGYDLRALLSDSENMDAVKVAISAELRKDERCLTVDVDISETVLQGTEVAWDIQISGETSLGGTYDFTLQVGSVTVELLNSQVNI